MAGRFVTLEGIDGAGKSTHLQRLAGRLGQGGREVVVTREPGGTPLAEALLVFAARRDHLQRIIGPALDRGAIVLCDRFTDATFAYQGSGRGVDATLLRQLEASVQEGRQPDLTLWLDLPARTAAQRRAAAREADRFEAEDLEFFERVRRGYAERCGAAPRRFARIDATLAEERVWAQIEAALAERAW